MISTKVRRIIWACSGVMVSPPRSNPDRVDLVGEHTDSLADHAGLAGDLRRCRADLEHRRRGLAGDALDLADRAIHVGYADGGGVDVAGNLVGGAGLLLDRRSDQGRETVELADRSRDAADGGDRARGR